MRRGDKQKANLAKRRTDYEAMMKKLDAPAGAYRRPGSLRKGCKG